MTSATASAAGAPERSAEAETQGAPVTLGHRFAPVAWNHVGRRWEAMRRARGE